MKKIVIVIGSPRGRQSNTAGIIKTLMEKVDSYNKKYKLNIIYLSEMNINECCGCMSCFSQCRVCPKFKDDIQSIEEQIIESDILILASPVYAHNVPSIMKKFIDRVSYGLHVFRFAGKYGYVITTSSSNGNIFVEDYLKKLLMYFGVKCVDEISIQLSKGVNDKKIEEVAEKISEIIADKLRRNSNEYEEKYYEIIKSAMIEIRKNHKTNEVLYWERHDFFQYEKFEDLFTKEQYAGQSKTW